MSAVVMHELVAGFRAMISGEWLMRTGVKTKRGSRTEKLPLAFWDTSAVVVEATSRFYRLKHEGKITAAEASQAIRRLDQLRSCWDEIAPSEAVRKMAERLLARHKLRAGDAFQLAASFEW
jgi:hypothetical protein